MKPNYIGLLKKTVLRQFIFPAIILLLSTNLFAQNISISGRVISATGNAPLPGVTITVKGSAKSTLTDADGNFKLNTAVGQTLIITAVGFTEKQIKVANEAAITIMLEENAGLLDEVVVIGYGTQSREKVIGSVSQVSAKDINNRPVTQLKNALTGQLAGVTITQRSGRPGAGSGAISVRGVGSFGASPNALILVDGTIVENFNDIDPNDVETISVLKDASSAAIYGSRAANGVILVTTKSGKVAPPQLSYNSYVGFQKATAMPEYVNSWEYQQAYFEAENGTSVLTPAQIAIVEKYKAQNDPNFPNNNFLKSVLSKNGFQTNHNISINGGTNANKYNLSLGYLYQNGLVVQNDYKRYNLRMNTTTALGSKFSVTTRLAAISSKTNEPFAPAGATGSGGLLGIIGQAARMPNTFVGRYENGDFGVGLANAGTPISNLASNSFDKQRNLNLNGNIRMDYKPVRGLKLSFISSYIQNNGQETLFRSTQRINATITLGPNVLTESTNANYYYTLQGLGDYSKQIGKHFFSILGGYSFEDYKSEFINAFRDNLPSNDLTVLNTGSLNNQQSEGSGAAYALESQFARANYSYANKYLVEGVVRRDGSSRFPTTKKYAVFPSVAAGWRIAQENFFRDNIDWINELKLKASWGVLGNQNISNYPYQNTLVSSNSNSSGTFYTFGGTIAPGAARTTIVDSTLHWESTRTKDVGIEVEAFKNKLKFSATYFDRYTYDILYSPNSSVSNVLGFNLSQRNTGKLKNTGWEFTAGYNNAIQKFTYNVNTNFTIIKNRVLDLGVGNVLQPNGLIGNGSDLFIGYPNSNGSYALYYGYVADGLFTDAQDVTEYQKANNQKAINPNPKPGDIRYKDVSGPNGIPDGLVDAAYDRVILGSQIPKYSYGINLGGSYAGFSLNVLLQGIAGVTGRLQSYASWAFYNTTGNIQRWQYEGHWTDKSPDRNAIYPRLETVPNTGVPNTLLSSYWTLNGSYVRIKNVQLGYSIPKQVLQKLKISKAGLYISGDNLHTFSNYIKGWDPEINGNADYYPILATYTLGLNITF